MSTAPAYIESKDALRKRLARVEGQVRGVAQMVEDERYCVDVLTQIGAIQAALDKVAPGVLDDHVRHCVVHGRADREPDQLTDEVLGAVTRLMRRG